MSTVVDRQDGLSSATAWKGPCRVATTGNITLSGMQVVDGLTVAALDRVLVWQQDDGTENGIYVVNTGVWRRSKDFSRNGDVIKGTRVAVTKGSAHANNVFQVASENPIVIGSDDIDFDMVEDAQAVLDQFVQWTPMKFEATGDGEADDLAAIQEVIDFLAENTPGSDEKRYAYCHLDLGGRTYAVSDQIIVHGPPNPQRRLFLKISNGGFVATDDFAPQADGDTAPRPLIIFQDGAYGAIMEEVYVDCNMKCSGVCIVPSDRASRHIHIKHNTIRRFANPHHLTEATINVTGESPPLPDTNPYRPYGIRIGTLDTFDDDPPSSMVTIENNNIAQWDNNDEEGDNWNNFTGIGISVHAIDSKVRFNAIDSVRKAIAVRGWNNEISFNHPSPPTTAIYDVDHSSERISGIEIEQYGNNRIIGNYVDNGFITLYQKNQIIGFNFFSWNPSSTFANSAGICFVAVEASEVIDNDMIIMGNQLMDTLDAPYMYIERAPFSFANKIGNGDVSQLIDIGYRQRTIARFANVSSALKLATAGAASLLEYLNADSTKSVMFGASGDELVARADGSPGVPLSGVLRKHLNDNDGLTLSTDHTGYTITNNAGGGTTYLLSNAADKGTEIKLTRRNGAVTVDVEAGATLNGGTTPISVTSKRTVTLLVIWNDDDESAEWTVEGSFS
jgi:hypothetical protein